MQKMMNLVIGICLIGIIFFSGCTEPVGKIVQDIVVCNSPYIKVGTSCCLDQNDNSICDKDETLSQLQTYCDDGTCQSNESCSSCPQDCGECKNCPSSCDDNNPCTLEWCNESTNFECKYKKITPCCGNAKCEKTEDCLTCVEDCECQEHKICDPERQQSDSKGCYTVHCGDNICDNGENNTNCCLDCPCDKSYDCVNNTCVEIVEEIYPYCGDGICESDENWCTCPQDCLAPSCSTCQQVICLNNQRVCETQTNCCGNEECESNESCSTCPLDCGSCQESEPQDTSEPEDTPICPSSCDDSNICTFDWCNSISNYECRHDLIIPCCGNNICEADENKCSCTWDCEECTGNCGACKEYSCVNNICECRTISNCCNNGVCELGEGRYDSNPCVEDCGIICDGYKEWECDVSGFCGDGTCGIGETFYSCSLDCPNCDDNNDCTVDSYSYSQNQCIYETITPCCGNNQCETDENCGNCPEDCLSSNEVCCNNVAQEECCKCCHSEEICSPSPQYPQYPRCEDICNGCYSCTESI